MSARSAFAALVFFPIVCAPALLAKDAKSSPGAEATSAAVGASGIVAQPAAFLPAYLAAASKASPDDVVTRGVSPSPILPVSNSPVDGRIHRTVKPGTPYKPLSTREKAEMQLLSTFQPETLARIAVTSGLATLRDSPNEWPRTIETYNWRYADRVGQRLIYKNTEFLVGSLLLHEDPRYFLAEKPGTAAKLRNALKQTWMTRRDNGSWAPAWGAFAGAYSAGYVSAQWMPESRQTAESILIRSSTQIGFRFCNNLLREFGPAIKKKFRR
ncbi:MAG: hypothetical protein U5J83_17430 [Bryobacterales bacterium]|nr:hypothetical protein [Bryobacterales bacterium]